MNENEAPEDGDIEQQSASISEEDKGNGSILTQIEQDAARDRIKTLMASTTAPMLEVGEVLSQVVNGRVKVSQRAAQNVATLG